MPNTETLDDVIARLGEPSQPGDTCGNDCKCTFISDTVLRQVLDERASLRVENGAMATWLDKITSAGFFGPTAPETSTMQFTITVTAAEWRTMRALVDASKQTGSARLAKRAK